MSRSRSPLERGGRRTLRTALWLAVFAIGMRVAVVAASLAIVPSNLEELSSLHDGREFQIFAAALASPEELAKLPWEARRLGPGYPAAIALLSLVIPPAVASLLLAVVGAGLATALVYLLGASPRAAAVFAVLTPSWVVFSSTAMSEGLFLTVALSGLLTLWRGRDVPAAVLFGAATLVRPVGAVLFAALWIRRWDRQSWKRRAASIAGFVALPSLWLWLSGNVWSAPMAQVRTYANRDGALPLESLFDGMAIPWDDPLKALQNVLVLSLVVGAGWMLRRGSPVRAEEPPRSQREDWFWWIASQAGFYLLLPSAWVFECLPRFLVTTLPGVAIAFDPWLRRRRLPVVVLAVISGGVTLYWNLRALGGG